MNSDLFDQLWELNPDAILVKELDGKILFWNPAAVAIFGYTSDEAAGRLVTELIVPVDRTQEHHEYLQEALVHGLAVYETVRRRSDLSLVHCSITTKVIRDGGGNPRYFFSTAKDVTRLKVLRDSKLVEAKYRDLLEST
ncbi:MAG TPA: PAS domain S-box protein, partial [Burkholderiales bacterium]|nr:PAS domain S-box protein [Burkholderiales bacterium]